MCGSISFTGERQGPRSEGAAVQAIEAAGLPTSIPLHSDVAQSAEDRDAEASASPSPTGEEGAPEAPKEVRRAPVWGLGSARALGAVATCRSPKTLNSFLCGVGAAASSDCP